MTASQERHGLPSASAALYDSLCHGRFLLQKQWEEMVGPEEEQEPENGAPTEDMDRDREAGKRIHLLYAGKECPDATDQERERAEKGRKVDEIMKERWRQSFEHEPQGEVNELREQRWWLKDDSGQEIYSGQTDAVWIRGLQGQPCDILVGDLKGLWGHHDPAPLNMQIRRYIALISQNVQSLGFAGLRSAMGYLNQPAVTLNPTPVVFDEADIQTAVFEMLADIAAISDPNAERTPGSTQCLRCKAKLICPEYQGTQTSIVKMVAPGAKDESLPSKSNLEQSLKGLTGEQMARLLPWCSVLINAAELAQAEAKRRLRINEESIPGWRLVPNAPRSKVDDVLKVFNRVHQMYGVSAEEFTKICSVTKTNCEAMIKEKSGLKGKELIKAVKDVLDGATMPIMVSASLERYKV